MRQSARSKLRAQAGARSDGTLRWLEAKRARQAAEREQKRRESTPLSLFKIEKP